ncbi:MAG: helix-turn-helix transcriptional regulator [Anaerolineae bacterium]|nr:helix-turn-helix transcriptional regulator [Anaerolineae bacterium]
MSKLTRVIHLPQNGTCPYPGATTTPLSEREREVLHWLASGASNREIGRKLSIAESTVKRHVYHIYGKLNICNRTQAVLWAIKLGVSPGGLIADSHAWNEANGLKS